jgi:GMC oxidoreductase
MSASQEIDTTVQSRQAASVSNTTSNDGRAEFDVTIVGGGSVVQCWPTGWSVVWKMNRDIARQHPFSDIVGAEIMPGSAKSDRASINAGLAGTVESYQHPTSTVPMGGPRDPSAVVDVDGRVRSIKGLRVVDASIWPDVPSVATAFPTMMLAERIAARMA